VKQWVNISDAVEITNNRVKPFKGERRYLATGDLIGDAVNESIVSVDYESKPSRADLLVGVGDIIVARMQATNKVLLIDKATEDLIVSTGFLTLQPKKDFDGSYLAHYFQSDLFQKQKDKYCSGATQKAINNGAFAKLQVPSYSLDEQKRIANILDQADALRQKRKQSLQLLDDFLRATFLDMFGDPQENPKGFAVRELNEFYCDDKNGTKCGPFGSALKKEEYTSEGIPVWNMDNISLDGQMMPKINLFISEEKYLELKAYSTFNGDVLISRAGTVGKMCVLKSSFAKSIISTNLIRVRFGEELLPEYFVALMIYCKGKVGRLKTGPDGSFTHMNTGILDSLKFPYPSIELQKEFLRLKNNVDKVKDRMIYSLDEVNNQFNALTQRYFG
jgi:type I restriction enzyme S subunit